MVRPITTIIEHDRQTVAPSTQSTSCSSSTSCIFIQKNCSMPEMHTHTHHTCIEAHIWFTQNPLLSLSCPPSVESLKMHTQKYRLIHHVNDLFGTWDVIVKVSAKRLNIKSKCNRYGVRCVVVVLSLRWQRRRRHSNGVEAIYLVSKLMNSHCVASDASVRRFFAPPWYAKCMQISIPMPRKRNDRCIIIIGVTKRARYPLLFGRSKCTLHVVCDTVMHLPQPNGDASNSKSWLRLEMMLLNGHSNLFTSFRSIRHSDRNYVEFYELLIDLRDACKFASEEVERCDESWKYTFLKQHHYE